MLFFFLTTQSWLSRAQCQLDASCQILPDVPTYLYPGSAGITLFPLCPFLKGRLDPLPH